MIAMDMKGRGLFLSRSLSFDGAEFDIVDETVSPTFEAMYEAATVLWARMLSYIATMTTKLQTSGMLTDAEVKSLNNTSRTFWAAHQRFFRQLCLAAKVPAIVKLVNQALAADMCVIIGLQSTGEARTSAKVGVFLEHGLKVAYAPQRFLKQTCFGTLTTTRLPLRVSLRSKTKGLMTTLYPQRRSVF